MKRRWFIVSLLSAMFALGVAGGAVLAQETPTEGGTAPEPEATGQGFAARLASKLGLGEEVVKTAISEVRQEIHSERLQRKLAMLVEKGKLTQEQADEYLQWFESRPEFLAQGSRLRGLGGIGFHRGKFRGGRGFHGPRGFSPSSVAAPLPPDVLNS